jgi:hypothetical protein
VLGPLGRRVYALAAAVCALGSMHANVFALGHICVAAAERAYLPRKLAWTDATVKDTDAPRGDGFRARLDDAATAAAGLLTARFLCLPKVRGVPM